MDTEGPCDDPGNPELLKNWDLVETAMDKLFEPSLRRYLPDRTGKHFRIGWFFLTWTGFATNPRGRDFGYHRIRDHYLLKWGEVIEKWGDEQAWHYHQPAASGVGNEWGLEWGRPPEHLSIITRQILERGWFPTAYRAGGTIMDAESARWVDDWFPIDYSNRAPLHLPGLVDWSMGQEEWGLYHPDTEDFRRPGAGRRHMARCLDLVTGVHSLSESDIEEAFRRAESGQPAILSCFDHDYRDIEGRILDLFGMIRSVSSRFSNVPWVYSTPTEAVRRYLGTEPVARLDIEAVRSGDDLHIWTSAPVHQSIPWIAVQRLGEFAQLTRDIHRSAERHWVANLHGLDWDQIGIGCSVQGGTGATLTIENDGDYRHSYHDVVAPRSATAPHSVWEHTRYYSELCSQRASGELPQTDSVIQALQLASPDLVEGSRVLDVGCGAAHAWRDLGRLGVVYQGIDSSERALQIGRALQKDLPQESTIHQDLNTFWSEKPYDVILCLNFLHFQPMFHLPLEIMARLADKCLVVRSCFGHETEVRFVPDVLLEPGFQSMRMYANVFGRSQIEDLLELEGFEVEWVEDQRQRDVFAGQPEVVGGISFDYEFLVARRVRERPSHEEIIGPDFSEPALLWRDEKRAG